MISYVVVFGISFIIVQVVTFTECRPLSLYWQVLPNPGNCSQAQVQLITLGTLTTTQIQDIADLYIGVLNIITDIMLIILPIPVLIKLRRSLFQ